MATGYPRRSKGWAATVRLAAWCLVLALAAACSAGRSAPQDAEGGTETAPEVEDEAAEDPAVDEDLAGPTSDHQAEPEPEPAPVSEPPPPPEDRDELVARARRLLESTLDEADGGVLAVHVIDEHGREVVSNDADTDVLPASTLKIVTAAAVLRTFGPDATFETRVETTAPVAVDGTIRGDVVLVGGGDPALATEEYGRWVYPARPRTPLEELAEELVAAGVERIQGDVIGRVSGFDGPQVATGWPDRYFSDLDARYSSGLTVDGGLRTIVEYPEPESDGDEEDGDATDAGEQDDDEAAQPDDGEAVDPEDLPDPIVRVEHAAEPAAHATAEFVRVLEDRDVEVMGEPTLEVSEEPVVGRLASVHSPPVSELLRFAVQRSDNQLTDGLFRAVGQARTGDGSFSGGERALRQVLTGLDIEVEGTRFADGSGLSRDDRVTARALVELDRAMRASRYAPTWASLMAVMGESGTLSSRLRGTLAEGRFMGKTGTLRDVSGLVGTVRGTRGGTYHLAVIANDQGELRWLGRTFADELVLLLTADLEGCSTSLEGEDTGALGLPPLAIAC